MKHDIRARGVSYMLRAERPANAISIVSLSRIIHEAHIRKGIVVQWTAC
jgi:hypothetical protein